VRPPVAWILAYGSLADEAPADAPIVVVRGLRRAWSVALDNGADLPGYKHYLLPDGSRPACHVAFLDVVEDDRPGAAIDAVLYPVADARALEVLDRRERNYERVDARDRVVDPPVDGPLWLYVGLRQSRDRAAAALAAQTLRVSRRYADRCAAAFARRGAEASARYLASTAPCDALLEDLRRIDHREK
jgi:hypothetical protein